jgi:hypothetical protein
MCANIPVGHRPVDVIVNPTKNIIYVANAGSRTLHTINGTANQLTVGITYNVNPPNSGYINCAKPTICYSKINAVPFLHLMKIILNLGLLYHKCLGEG